MDPALLFRVLVVAKGFEPTFFPKTDPLTGSLEARLKPRAAPTMPTSQIILGRVLDPDKKPLANAVVSVEGTMIGNSTRGWPPEGTDPLAVSDESGEFEIRCPIKFDAMNLRVEARGFARRDFPQVRPGPVRRELGVTVGAVLTGRVLHSGKPVTNITIGVASVNRGIGEFTGDFVTGTGADGTFAFLNLPPDREYAAYGLMDSLKGIGALPTRTVRVKGDSSKNDLGDWELSPGWRLAGQVRLADTNVLPGKTRLVIGRDAAWDSASIELPPDGRFSLTHVPGETLNVSARVKGYRLAARNASLDRLNPFHLTGRLTTDKTNLIILLEPGKDLESESNDAPEGGPENLPLGGIEVKRTVPDAITLSGRVLDANTQSPVPQFQVTPGHRHGSQSDWTEWQPSRAVTGTNGTFTVELSAKAGWEAVCLIEADGYLPFMSEPLAPGQTNWVGHLKPGRGPGGMVQLPDGQPATNATVGYMAGREQGSLNKDGELSVHDRYRKSTRRTDAQGRFSFAPKLGEGQIIAVSPDGFARVSATFLETNQVIALEPWAQVRGRLVQNGKPVPGENVDAQFRGAWQPNQPYLNLHGTRTDDEGRFTIDYLPPGSLQLTTRLPEGNGAWRNSSQRPFTAKPGEHLDLGDIEKTDPPKR